MEVYLLRHGETSYNALGYYQGMHDIPLSEAGRAKLRRAEISPGRVYVTPLCRTAQTAAVLFPDAEIVAVEELREMSFGRFEGRSDAQLAQDPDYIAWMESKWAIPCPGGERLEDFAQRSCAALARLIEESLEQGEESLVVVAHGGTQMAVMERMARPRRSFIQGLTGNGAGYVLGTDRWQSDGVLELLREVSYGT